MSLKHKKFYLIYILWLLLFIFFTNQYYNFNEIVSINQLDSVSYMSIAISAPDYSSENMPYHHAQRVFFPYLVGQLSNIFDIDVIVSFRLVSFFLIFITIFLHFLITKKLKTDFYVSIISISLLILNPYLIRYFIAVPTMISDTTFILSLYLFLFGLIHKNNSTLFAVFLGLISRQNGIFIFIAYVIDKFFVLKYKAIRDKSIILSILILLIVSLTANNYASKVSTSSFDFGHAYGIFEWFLTDWNLANFLKWTVLPLYSYFPITIIFLFFFKLKDYDRNILKDYIILIFIFLSIIGVSYLPGPEMADRNIIRQTSLAYPIFLVGGL